MFGRIESKIVFVWACGVFLILFNAMTDVVYQRQLSETTLHGTILALLIASGGLFISLWLLRRKESQ